MRDNIPFTYPWIFQTKLKHVKRILDIGCGKGEFMQTINYSLKYDVCGIELFEPYIKLAKKKKIYTKIIRGDIKKIEFNKNSFEAVMCNQVIEHLKRKDGLALIKKMEKTASNIVIIGTPNGQWHQEEYDSNKLQRHLSHWSAEDFTKLGYQVYGQGLKVIYGENGLLSDKGVNIFIKLFLFSVSYLLSPIIYKLPSIAAYLVAVKRK